MRLRVRVTPRTLEPDETPVARNEALSRQYSLRTAVEEIDKAIRNRRPLRLMLENGNVLAVDDVAEYQSIAVADLDVAEADDEDRSRGYD